MLGEGALVTQYIALGTTVSRVFLLALLKPLQIKLLTLKLNLRADGAEFRCV